MVAIFSSSSSPFPTSLRSIVRSGVLAALALTLACATLSSSVDAHGFVTHPSAEFLPGTEMRTGFSATMSPVFDGKFNGSPQQNVDVFTEAFNAHKDKYPNLKALVSGHGKDCGNTNEFATPKPIPTDGVVVWQNPDSGEGFVPSHMGPCEIWLGDTLVFHDDNCAGNYPSKPKAVLNVNYSECKGEKCLLQFYWLALHEPTWQIYKNCVPLIGNGGAYDGGNANVVANEYSTPSSQSTSLTESGKYNEYKETPATPGRPNCHPKRKRSLRG